MVDALFQARYSRSIMTKKPKPVLGPDWPTEAELLKMFETLTGRPATKEERVELHQKLETGNR